MKKITLTIVLTVNTIIGVLGQNLVSNSSFETSGQLNCQLWYNSWGQELTYLCDTIYPDPGGAYFFQDAPLGGGNWCLSLTPGWCPSFSTAETYITGQVDTNIYELKVWMKTSNWSGSISLGLLSQNQLTITKTITDNPTTWTQYTLVDTLITQLTDTIVVHLSAGCAESASGSVFIDLIELNKDTISNIENNKQEKSNNVFYPNPFSKLTTLKIKENVVEGYTLILYSSIGQIIRQIVIEQEITTIDKGELLSGIYFYQIKSKIGKKLIGQGKLIIE